MIDVSDADVSNLLVDTCGVESTILIAEMNEAQNVMSSTPPKNVRAVRRERERGGGDGRREGKS